MHILLKNVLKEVEEKSPLQIQMYVDMDGVLVNLDKGFKEVSGGLLPKEYEDKNGKNTFWKVVNKYPNFWLDLEPMADATVLWDFIRDNFKTPVPVILSAGQGTRIAEQKTSWIRKHIDPSVRVIIASSGVKKPNYILQDPTKRITHLLLDDTQKNIDVWDNPELHRVAILHKNAADSIRQLRTFINK